MAEISINWGTKVITIPKDYTQLVQSSPSEIRQLDLDVFRLDLKDLEDSEAGMPMLDTHNHVLPITFGGVTLARVIEIINGYTITFEDGQYAVNLVGANSNVGDVINVNQVSVRSNNSAGLTFSETINDQSFLGGRIFIDPDRGLPGTQFPRGTPSDPVNNYADAKAIADDRKFFKYQLEGAVVLDVTDDIEDTDWFGNDLVQSSIVLAGTPTTDCVFHDMEISGAFNGRVVLNNCRTSNVTNFSGVMRRCEFSDTVTIDANNVARVTFTDCQSSVPGTTTPVLDWNNAACDGEIRKYAGGVRLINFTQPGQAFSFDILSGHVVIDESCTEGTIVVRGGAKLTNLAENNANLNIDTSGLILPESSFNGRLEYKETSVYTGQLYPYGSLQFPVNNWTDIEALATRYKINDYIIKGDLTLGSGNSLAESIVTGTSIVESSITLANTNTTNCVFDKITIDGYLSGACTINRAVVNNVYGFAGVVRKSRLTGNIVLDVNAGSNVTSVSFENTISGVPGGGSPILDWNGAIVDGEMRGHYGGVKLTNFNQPGNSFSFDVPSGHVILDSTCTEGTIVVRGTAKITNNTLANSNVVVDTSGLVYPESAYRGEILYNEDSSTSGNRYPYGTSAFPVNNYEDLESIGDFYNIKTFKVGGTLLLNGAGSDIHTNETYIGARSVLSSVVNIESVEDFSGTGFERLTLTGNVAANTSPMTAIDCVFNNLYGYWGGLQNCGIQGTLQVGGPQLFGQGILFSGSPTVNLANVCTSFSGYVNGGDFTISNAPANALINLTLAGNEVTIDSSNDPSATFNFEGLGSITDNSTSIIESEHLLYPSASYQGEIYYDPSATKTGNLFPYGVSTLPVNNYNDIETLSGIYNIKNIRFTGDINIPSSANISGYEWTGSEIITSEIILNGSSMENSVFNDTTIGGTANGSCVINNSRVEDIINFSGIIKNSELESNITMDSSSTRTSHTFQYTTSSDGIPVLDWNGISANGDIRGHLGPILLKNFNQPGYTFSFDVPSGHIILDSSCTEGTIIVRGSGRFTNNTLANSNVVVDTSGFIFPEAAYIGAVYYDASSQYSGNTYPIGTPLFAVNNHSDMYQIGLKYNLSTYRTSGTNLIPTGHGHNREAFIGHKSVVGDILELGYSGGGGPIMSGSSFQKLTVTGPMQATEPLTVEDSILSDVSGLYGIIVDSAITGNLVIGGPFTDLKGVSFESTPNIDMNYECFALRGVVDGGDARIKNVPTGGIVDLTIQGSLIVVDASANAGSTIIISGYGNVVNQSSATVNTNDLLSVPEVKLIPNAVWAVDNTNPTANTFGASLSTIENNTANLANLDVNVNNSDIANAVWLTDVSTYGAGTAGGTLQSASTGNVDYDTLSSSVWNIDPTSNTYTANSIARSITNISDRTIRILGLTQENFRYKDQIYVNGNMVSGNILIYESATDLDNETNEVAIYNIEASYDTDGLLTDYKVKKN